MTDAEVRVWSELRRRAIGVRFHHQHPIGPYILDLACLALKRDIELDGSQHYEAVTDDAHRDKYSAEKVGRSCGSHRTTPWSTHGLWWTKS